MLMKKMMVAALLALAVTASARQEASAWSKFNFGVGLNLSYETTGSCFGWGFNCAPNPPPCGYGACPSYPAYAGYPAYGFNFGAPALAPAAPVAAPAAAPVRTQYTQQVGYYFYNQGNAPAYWYGY
jgi:hypothetical protein